MFQFDKIDNINTKLSYYQITNSKYNINCKIFQNLGASIQELTYNNVKIIEGITTDNDGLTDYKSTYKSSVLFPFPNRISDGKYSYKNKNYQLPINEIAFNNTLHGCVFDKEFALINSFADKNKIELTFNYTSVPTDGFPFYYSLNLTYTITSEFDVILDFEVINKDDKSFPFGIGWHPYFYSNDLKNSKIDFPSVKKVVFNDKMIPFYDSDFSLKKPMQIEEQFLDDCFYLTEPNSAFETPDYKLDLSFSKSDPNYYLQVYTPPTRKSIAIEPMTCAPNSFNNKIGLLELEPKESYFWNVKLQVTL